MDYQDACLDGLLENGNNQTQLFNNRQVWLAMPEVVFILVQSEQAHIDSDNFGHVFKLRRPSTAIERLSVVADIVNMASSKYNALTTSSLQHIKFVTTRLTAAKA